MRTFRGISNEKGSNYKRGFKRAKSKRLTEKELKQIRMTIQSELLNYAIAEFQGQKFSTKKLERYVGLSDGYDIPVSNIFNIRYRID